MTRRDLSRASGKEPPCRYLLGIDLVVEVEDEGDSLLDALDRHGLGAAVTASDGLKERKIYD